MSEKNLDCFIHPSAVVGPEVKLEKGARIGANAVLKGNVSIGEGCHINSGCVVGEEPSGVQAHLEQYTSLSVEIGPRSVIRSGTVIYEGVQIGEGFQSGNHACIREGTKIGRFSSVGSFSGVEFGVSIGDYTRIHSFNLISENARIGNYVWIMPGSSFANDNIMPLNLNPEFPIIGDFCVLGSKCLFFPGVHLGVHVIVAAGSKVRGAHEDFSFIEGDPARKVCDSRKYFTKANGKIIFPYPWIKHVDRNYPWSGIPPAERRIENYLRTN